MSHCVHVCIFTMRGTPHGQCQKVQYTSPQQWMAGDILVFVDTGFMLPTILPSVFAWVNFNAVFYGGLICCHLRQRLSLSGNTSTATQKDTQHTASVKNPRIASSLIHRHRSREGHKMPLQRLRYKHGDFVSHDDWNCVWAEKDTFGNGAST